MLSDIYFFYLPYCNGWKVQYNFDTSGGNIPFYLVTGIRELMFNIYDKIWCYTLRLILDIVYLNEDVSFNTKFTETFIINGYWILSNDFLYLLRWIYVFSSLLWWIMLFHFEGKTKLAFLIYTLIGDDVLLDSSYYGSANFFL